MQWLDQYFKSTKEDKRSKAAIAFFASLDHIAESNPVIAKTIVQELKDQRSHIKLIASENFSSLAVQLAMGNLLTDKYAEGYPHHRFYAGCENVDVIEEIAVEELKSLFGCDHAYVQPHSGSDANLVAIWAFLIERVQSKEIEKLGKKRLEELTPEEYEVVRKICLDQKMMGLSLNSGGHLTHGYCHNISSKIFQAVPYEVDPKTGLLDYGQIEAQVKREKPSFLMVGYSAYPRLINFAKMREIAESVGAVMMVDMAHFSGLVAGKVFQGEYDPIPFAHLVTSTTHKTLRGPRGGIILCKNEFKEAVNRGCPLVLGGPLPHVMAAKAIAFKEAKTPDFQKYAHHIVANSNALAERLMEKGCALWSNGTDNHLMVIDVNKSFGLTGRQAELALREGGFTVNRNTIPGDTNGPWYTSGVRLGTPAMTTLGMREDQMKEIGLLMSELLKATKPAYSEKLQGPSRAKVEIEPNVLAKVKLEAKELLSQFPLYPELNLNPNPSKINV